MGQCATIRAVRRGPGTGPCFAVLMAPVVACYTAGPARVVETNVEELSTEATGVGSYVSKVTLGDDALIVSVSREASCKVRRTYVVESEEVRTMTERNWPKVPMFITMGLGAFNTGIGAILLTSVHGSTRSDEEMKTGGTILLGSGIALLAAR